MADETTTAPATPGPIDLTVLIAQADSQLATVNSSAQAATDAQSAVDTARQKLTDATLASTTALASLQVLGQQIVDAVETKYLMRPAS